MIRGPIEREEGLAIRAHQEGHSMAMPGNDFNIKVSMRFEGNLKRGKKQRDPTSMPSRYPRLFSTTVGAREIKKQGRRILSIVGPTKNFKRLKKSLAIGMKLSGREMQVVQDLDLTSSSRIGESRNDSLLVDLIFPF
jgi:hypothetical protein